MKRFSFIGASGEQVAKRMFFLAWNACGGPTGMGFLQDRGLKMNEESIFKNVVSSGDYATSQRNVAGSLYGDYVFGRMMKLGIKFGTNYVELCDMWRSDYQAFCGKYPDAESLVGAAVESLGAKFECTFSPGVLAGENKK